MGLLTRDDILKAADLPTEDVPVPEWGGTVRVRAISGAERDRFEAGVAQRNGSGVKLNMVNVRARLVAMAIVDEDGARVFTDKDVEELGKKSASALDRVFDAAQRLAGLGKRDMDEMTENFQ